MLIQKSLIRNGSGGIDMINRESLAFLVLIKFIRKHRCQEMLIVEGYHWKVQERVKSIFSCQRFCIHYPFRNECISFLSEDAILTIHMKKIIRQRVKC